MPGGVAGAIRCDDRRDNSSMTVPLQRKMKEGAAQRAEIGTVRVEK
jgi:hypothetical protein